MHHVTAKRDFLKGRFERTGRILPPGSLDDFYDMCTKCGDCASACPTDIIYKDSDGFPVVNLKAGACLFCSACAEACEAGAIEPADGWDVRAKAASNCLSLNGVTCRTCEDQCDNQAIRFKLKQGGRSEPEFDSKACIGCGACASACPAGAIQFYEPKHHEEMPC